MKRYILPVVVLSLCVLFAGCKKDDENAKDVLENIQSSSVSATAQMIHHRMTVRQHQQAVMTAVRIQTATDRADTAAI